MRGLIGRSHKFFQQTYRPQIAIKICTSSEAYVKDSSYSASDFSDKLTSKKKEQEEIENSLVEYYETITVSKVDSKVRKEIIDSFIAYIFDNSASDALTVLISGFVLSKADDSNFVSNINQIKEGLILLNGLSYTDDITSIVSLR